MENVFYILIVCSFFGVNLFFTQKIYNKGYIYITLLFSLLLPISILCFFPLKKSLPIFSFSLILIYYSILLLATKMVYKNVNSFLIKLSIINKKFEHKDFTYLNWDSSNPTTPMWWDKQLARSPSLLDLAFTFILIAIPFLLCGLTSYFLTSLFVERSFFN
jgi:hypothetical protein